MTVSRRSILKRVGTAGALSIAGCLNTDQSDLPGRLSVEWTSDTATEYDGNHHAIAAAAVDGQPVIGIPRNGLDDAESCGVVAVDATGEVLWNNPFPPEQCNPHAIGDIGIGDLDGDDQPEFLAATETQGVFAYDAATGEETFREDLLNSIGYSAPVAADLTGDGDSELAVVDFAGNLSVVRAGGSVAWTDELDNSAFVTPIVADLTGDGTLNLAVNYGRSPGNVVCFAGDGEIVWQVDLDRVSSTWSLVEPKSGPALVATTGDDLVSLDGSAGEQRWETEVGDRVAAGDADQTRVYAAARDGAVRALDLENGEILWSEQVAEEGVRIPPPAVGPITGDGAANVVAAAYDGTLAVLDGETGEMLARRQLDAGLYTQPVPAKLIGNDRDEILVLYGDARVAALSFEAEEN